MRVVLAALLLSSFATSAYAEDWTNVANNPARNGLSGNTGPATADIRWSGGGAAFTGLTLVIEGSRLFTTRPLEYGDHAEVLCLDVGTGAQLWSAPVPSVGDVDTTWVQGVSNGHVYANHAGNGMPDKIYALEADTGALLWTSEEEFVLSPQESLVFASNADLVVGAHNRLARVSGLDGSTLWSIARLGSGSAVFVGDALYAVDKTPDNTTTVVRRFDPSTGAALYASGPIEPSPDNLMAGPDGTIYVRGTQGPAPQLSAYTDTGSSFTLKWKVAVPSIFGATTMAITAKGDIVAHVEEGRLARIDSSSGARLATSEPLALTYPLLSVSADASNHVFVSAPDALVALDAALAIAWSAPVAEVNGAPAITADGAVVVANAAAIHAFGPMIPGSGGAGGATSASTSTLGSTSTASAPTSTGAGGGGPIPGSSPGCGCSTERRAGGPFDGLCIALGISFAALCRRQRAR